MRKIFVLVTLFLCSQSFAKSYLCTPKSPTSFNALGFVLEVWEDHQHIRFNKQAVDLQNPGALFGFYTPPHFLHYSKTSETTEGAERALHVLVEDTVYRFPPELAAYLVIPNYKELLLTCRGN